MADGLRNATLAALCSRGPWHGDTLDRVHAWTLTGQELRDLYNCVPLGPERMGRAIGDGIGSNKGNRATTLLKRAGLIHYDRAARVWRHGKAP